MSGQATQPYAQAGDDRYATRTIVPDLFFSRTAVGLGVWLALITGCDDADGPARRDATTQVVPPSAPFVPQIANNKAHNLLVGSSEAMRGYGLAEVVKSAEGKARCSGVRTMWQGATTEGQSFWNVACHDGTDWRVSLEPDGNTLVVSCAIGPMISSPCWERFES